MKKRENAYIKYRIEPRLSTAGISAERKLTQAGSVDNSNGWGFVVFENKVMLAQGKVFPSISHENHLKRAIKT